MRSAALSTLAAIATVTAGGASHAATDPWKALHRSLHVPRVAPGAACPVSKIDRSLPWRWFGVGPGLGAGPAFPVQAEPFLYGLRPDEWGAGPWGGQKVLWFIRPVYRGPVLVRGRRLDGPQPIRFDRGSLPSVELRISPGESVVWEGQVDGSRGRPSYTRLRAPGCYGYQIDGRTFSRVIVFRAEWAK